jgi:hypothetical protein
LERGAFEKASRSIFFETLFCSLNVLASSIAFRYLPWNKRAGMVQRVSTVAFEGIEARSVDVQVQVAPGLPAFAIVGSINPNLLYQNTDAPWDRGADPAKALRGQRLVTCV